MIRRANREDRIQTRELFDNPIGLFTLRDDIRDRVSNATEHSPEGLVRLRITVEEIQKEVERATAEEAVQALRDLDELPDQMRYDARIVGAIGGKEPPLLSLYESHGTLHEGPRPILAYQKLDKAMAKEVLMRMYRDRQLSFIGLGGENGKWRGQSVFGGFDVPAMRKNQEQPGEINIVPILEMLFAQKNEGDIWLSPSQPDLNLAMMAEADVAAEMGDDYANRKHNAAIIMPHGVVPKNQTP